MTKICSMCKQIKDWSDFYKQSQRKIGIRYECKVCSALKSKKYLSKNLNKITAKHKEWGEANPEKVKKYYTDRYQRIKNDPLFILESRLRKRTRTVLKGKKFKKCNKFCDYIGCTVFDLKLHLEKQFKDNMNWDNYGKFGWHIDHIIPLSSAKNEKELYELCHFSNLQPLWAKENLIKGSKIYAAKELTK